MTARDSFQHDQNQFKFEAMSRARLHCAEHGLILTPIRQQVLELLLDKRHALGAYDIIAELKSQGRKIQAPSVYRALDFLITNGLAHRVEKLNAYVASTEDHGPYHPILFVCDTCNAVIETKSSGLDAVLRNIAHDNQFTINSAAFEVSGQCSNCQEMAIAAE